MELNTIEMLGELAQKVVEERTKNETDDHIRIILNGVVGQSTVNTCGQSVDSHLLVTATIEEQVRELPGEQDHYSGVQHEPSFNGRPFGDPELKHLIGEKVVVQLAYLYTKYEKKQIHVHGEYSEEYGSWESGNDVYWEVDFTFPQLETMR